MKLEQQVTSLEISKRLKELGVNQESLFKWNFPLKTKDEKEYGYPDSEFEPRLFTEEQWELYAEDYNPPVSVMYSAFTVAELGEMLKNTGYQKDGNGYFRNTFWFKDAWYSSMDTDNKTPAITADTEADARGKMLIYLLENKLITI